jgi:S1-C subfamily serine protease
LGAAPETRPRDPLTIRSRSPLAGLNVANASPAVAEEIGVDSITDGVVIMAVEDGSPAQQVGFQKGDVLVSINNEQPKTTRDVERLTRDRAYRWIVQINRGGQLFTQQLFGG